MAIDLQQARRALAVESDRGLVLVTAAMVDGALSRMLQASFVDGIPMKTRRALLRDGSLSAKANMARAWGLIGPSIHAWIDAIREFRNKLAHSEEPLDFTTAEIHDQLRKAIPNAWPGTPPDGSSPPNAAVDRIVLQAAALFLVEFLDRKTIVLDGSDLSTQHLSPTERLRVVRDEANSDLSQLELNANVEVRIYEEMFPDEVQVTPRPNAETPETPKGPGRG